MAKVILRIQEEVFEVEKEILCKHSEYFRAMFSGNYKEDKQIGVSIEMVEPKIMSIILKYVIAGATDLSEHSLCTISDIAAAADYLLMTDLTKQVEQTLYKMDLCEFNWIEIMAIAENFSFLNVEQLCAAFGVYSFRSMSAEHIPTIHKLAWYLSHPYLDCQSELDVFNFGFQWVLNNGADADALLIVLSCLDYTRLGQRDIRKIKKCIKKQKFANSLAAKIVDCFFEMFTNGLEISELVTIENKSKICGKFTERVWAEAVDLTRESKSRLLYYTPVVYKDTCINFRYTYTTYIYKPCNGVFEVWLDVMNEPERWIMTSWGLTKLVVLYEELKKERMKKIKVYDTLRKEWEFHNVNIVIDGYTWTEAIVVVKDFLYIIGSRIEFRKYFAANVIEYDLKKKTYRKMEQVKVQESYPEAVCSHKDMFYTVIHKNICRYGRSERSDNWKTVVSASVENTVMTYMTSHKEYIYCIFRNNKKLYRFRPNVDRKLKLVTMFTNIPSFLISTGDKLLAFTKYNGEDPLTVEEYQDKYDSPILKVTNIDVLRTNPGFCALAISMPPLYKIQSDYINKHFKI